MTFNKRKIFKYIATFTIILLMLVNSGCKPLTLEVIDVIDSEPIDSQIEITTTSPATQTTTTPQITQTTPPIIATTPEPSTLVVTPLNQVMYVTGAGNIRTAPEIVDETRTGKTLIEGIEINVTGSAIGSDGEVWYSFIQDDITLWAHNQFFSSVNDEPSTSTPSSPEERARELASLTANDERIDNEWALWLINAWNPLPERYVPPSLQPIGGGFELDSRAAEYAKLMIEAARNDGITLTVVSSYRSEERQTNNFRNYFNNAVSAGRSREEAFAFTASQIAIPNTSEHNAGLAIDFNLISESFDQTPAFRWLQENSWKYGFILRYPKGTTDITGIIYEPWHYRFVGLHHAEQIVIAGVTLEEYMGDERIADEENPVVMAFKELIIGY